MLGTLNVSWAITDTCGQVKFSEITWSVSLPRVSELSLSLNICVSMSRRAMHVLPFIHDP